MLSTETKYSTKVLRILELIITALAE